MKTSAKNRKEVDRSGGGTVGDTGEAEYKQPIQPVKLLNTDDLSGSAIVRPAEPGRLAAGVGILRALAKVFVVGSTNTDMTVRVPRIPAPG